MSELKPCPFCGGKMKMFYSCLDESFHLYHRKGFDLMDCPICEPFVIDNVRSYNEAAEAWNRRATDE